MKHGHHQHQHSSVQGAVFKYDHERLEYAVVADKFNDSMRFHMGRSKKILHSSSSFATGPSPSRRFKTEPGRKFSTGGPGGTESMGVGSLGTDCMGVELDKFSKFYCKSPHATRRPLNSLAKVDNSSGNQSSKKTSPGVKSSPGEKSDKDPDKKAKTNLDDVHRITQNDLEDDSIEDSSEKTVYADEMSKTPNARTPHISSPSDSTTNELHRESERGESVLRDLVELRKSGQVRGSTTGVAGTAHAGSGTRLSRRMDAVPDCPDTAARVSRINSLPVLLGISVLMGCLKFSITLVVKFLSKVWVDDNQAPTGSEQDDMIIILKELSFALLASLICLPAPAAAGGGIAEIKTLLSGFIVFPAFLQTSILVCKCISLAFVLATKLPAGTEGPYVHISTCLLAAFFSDEICHNMVSSHTLLALVAVGVGVSCNTPIGGVLMGLEFLMPNVYDVATYWKCFVAAMVSTWVLFVLKALSGTDIQPFLFSDLIYNIKSQALPEFLLESFANLIISGFCGLASGIFIVLHRNFIIRFVNVYIKKQPQPPPSPKKRLGKSNESGAAAKKDSTFTEASLRATAQKSRDSTNKTVAISDNKIGDGEASLRIVEIMSQSASSNSQKQMDLKTPLLAHDSQNQTQQDTTMDGKKQVAKGGWKQRTSHRRTDSGSSHGEVIEIGQFQITPENQELVDSLQSQSSPGHAQQAAAHSEHPHHLHFPVSPANLPHMLHSDRSNRAFHSDHHGRPDRPHREGQPVFTGSAGKKDSVPKECSSEGRTEQSLCSKCLKQFMHNICWLLGSFRSANWRHLLLVAFVSLSCSVCARIFPLMDLTQRSFLNNFFSVRSLEAAYKYTIQEVALFLSLKFVLTMMTIGLPVAHGVISPFLVIGALLGRLIGGVLMQGMYYCVYLWISLSGEKDRQQVMNADSEPLSAYLTREVEQEMEREYFDTQFYQVTKGLRSILGISDETVETRFAKFALIGAVAFCSSGLRAFSIVATMVELIFIPGLTTQLILASFVSINVSIWITPFSILDSLIDLKKLPFLPSHPNRPFGTEDRTVEHIMTTEFIEVPRYTTYRKLWHTAKYELHNNKKKLKKQTPSVSSVESLQSVDNLVGDDFLAQNLSVQESELPMAASTRGENDPATATHGTRVEATVSHNANDGRAAATKGALTPDGSLKQLRSHIYNDTTSRQSGVQQSTQVQATCEPGKSEEDDLDGSVIQDAVPIVHDGLAAGMVHTGDISTFLSAVGLPLEESEFLQISNNDDLKDFSDHLLEELYTELVGNDGLAGNDGKRSSSWWQTHAMLSDEEQNVLREFKVEIDAEIDLIKTLNHVHVPLLVSKDMLLTDAYTLMIFMQMRQLFILDPNDFYNPETRDLIGYCTLQKVLAAM